MIDTMYVVYGPCGSGKRLNAPAICKMFGIGTTIHGNVDCPAVERIEGHALVAVNWDEALLEVPSRWFKLAKAVRVFSVQQIKELLGKQWLAVPALPAEPARKPCVSPVVERRLGFDPTKCSPEQWAALVWCITNAECWREMPEDQLLDGLREQVTVTATRISAVEPRTGDCLELAPEPGKAEGRRFFFVSVDPKRVIGDPVAWRTLCKSPGSTVHLGGLPA